MNWSKLVYNISATFTIIVTIVLVIFALTEIVATVYSFTGRTDERDPNDEAEAIPIQVEQSHSRYQRYIPTVLEQWNTLEEFESTAQLVNLLTERDWVSKSVSIQELDYILVLAKQLSSEFFPTVPTELVLAVISVESSFRPDLLGFNDDSGLMQVIPKFHKERIRKYLIDESSDIFDPRVNLSTGMDYLEELLAETEGDIALTLMCYNEGPSRAKKRYFNGVVSGYAEEVIARMEVISDALNRESQERAIESIINSKRGGAIDG